MARKKKNSGDVPMSASSYGPRRISVSVEEAENGFTINCSGSGKNGEYHSKSYVAPNERGAIRIAAESLSGGIGKKKGKKEKGKKASKMSIGKKG